jgi:hypothetical protein
LPSPEASHWFPLLTMLGGLALCGALWLGTLLNRPYFRWLAVIGCSGAILINQQVLVYEYAGPHLIVTLSSAILLGVAYSGVSLSETVGERLHTLRQRALPGLLVLGIAAVVITPRPVVAMRLFQTPGAVLAPFLTAFYRDRFVAATPPTDQSYAAWLEQRLGPAIAAGPPVLPREDLIVILLTIDSLRADLVGNPRHQQQLPALEAMRQRGLNFTRARSVAPLTRLTITSMFTGLYPFQLERAEHESQAGVRVVAKDVPYLALPGTPIRTVHVYSNVNIARGQALGFKETLGAEPGLGPHVLQVLRGHGHGPLFVYAHFMEPHPPYGDEQHSHLPDYERYLLDVAEVDRQLAELRRYIQQSDKRERTILIVSADHGEAFGEHGFKYHAKTVYEEMIRIPLLIEVPGITAREIATPVSTIDLAPTVLDLFGQPTPAQLMGVSLAGFMRGEEPVFQRPIVAQTALGLLTIVFPDERKVIYDRKRRLGELYDLRADPGERNNLLEEPAGSRHLGTLIRFYQAHARPGGY